MTQHEQESIGKRNTPGEHFLICLTFLVPYLAITLSRLGLPGSPLDETTTVLPWVDFHGPGLGPWRLPLVLAGYHGALESYFIMPFVGALGRTVEALRICSITFGVLTLVAFYAFAVEYFEDKGKAWAAAFLLATASVYVTGSRFGVYHAVIPLFFQTGALLGLILWKKTGRDRYLCLTALAQGAAVSCRSWFFFSMAALLASSFLLPGRRMERATPGRRARLGILSLLLFCCGAFPLTVYVATHAGEFGRTVTSRFPFTRYRVDNRSYFSNLKVRCEQLPEMLGDDPYLREAFGTPRPSRALKAAWASAVCASFLWFAGMFFGRRSSSKRTLFLPVYCALLFLLSPFTLSNFRYCHLFPLVPMLVLLIASAFIDVADVLLRLKIRYRLWLIAGVVAFVRICDFPMLPVHLKTMAGVSEAYSDGILSAAEWLRLNRPDEPVFVHGEFSSPLIFFTDGAYTLQWLFPNPWVENVVAGPSYLIVPSSFRRLPFHASADVVRCFNGSGGEPSVMLLRVPRGGLARFVDAVRGERFFYVRMYKA